METFFHSDDFGVELSQSKAIRACRTGGALNSISVMTNSPNAEQCYEIIKNDIDKRRVYPVVHLNLIEGPAILPADEIPDLVDNRGFFKNSFVSLLLVSLLGGSRRRRIRGQIARELGAQIERFHAIIDNKDVPWGIDGHQHIHMIPMVWEALCQVIEGCGYRPDRIRRSVDPLLPILLTPSVWPGVRPVNIIKWLLLFLISPSYKRTKAVCRRVPVFFGMFFTCRMEESVVRRLLPRYRRFAEKRGRDLELMFHPGYLRDRSKTLDPQQEALYDMISSDFRIKEQRALKALK